MKIGSYQAMHASPGGGSPEEDDDHLVRCDDCGKEEWSTTVEDGIKEETWTYRDGMLRCPECTEKAP